MTDAKDFIRLDNINDNRYVAFTGDVLRAIANLLPEAKFEVTHTKTNGEEVVLKVSASELGQMSFVRTVVIAKADTYPKVKDTQPFLEKMLEQRMLPVTNIVVTDFVRLTGLGGGNDVHGSTFSLEDYVHRKPVSQGLKGASETMFQTPKPNVIERFFSSKFGFGATLTGIIGVAGFVHFSALSEQQAAQKQPPTPEAHVPEIAQQTQIQKQ